MGRWWPLLQLSGWFPWVGRSLSQTTGSVTQSIVLLGWSCCLHLYATPWSPDGKAEDMSDKTNVVALHAPYGLSPSLAMRGGLPMVRLVKTQCLQQQGYEIDSSTGHSVCGNCKLLWIKVPANWPYYWHITPAEVQADFQFRFDFFNVSLLLQDFSMAYLSVLAYLGIL